jgi:hypothetical protein
MKRIIAITSIAALALAGCTPPNSDVGKVTTTKDAPKATPTKKADVNTVTGFSGEGVYIVGEDIRPGTYKSKGVAAGSFGCYWARKRGTSGEVSDIIANEAAQGPQTVTIKKTDKAFETQGCANWVLVR